MRELTYVPDTDGLAVGVDRAAEALGGVPLDGHGGVSRHRSRLGAVSQSWPPLRRDYAVRRRCAARAVRRARGGRRVVGRSRRVLRSRDDGSQRRRRHAPVPGRLRMVRGRRVSRAPVFPDGTGGRARDARRAREDFRRGQPARHVQRPIVRRAVDGNAVGVSSRRSGDRGAAATSTCCHPARRLWGRRGLARRCQSR